MPGSVVRCGTSANTCGRESLGSTRTEPLAVHDHRAAAHARSGRVEGRGDDGVIGVLAAVLRHDMRCYGRRTHLADTVLNPSSRLVAGTHARAILMFSRGVQFLCALDASARVGASTRAASNAR